MLWMHLQLRGPLSRRASQGVFNNRGTASQLAWPGRRVQAGTQHRLPAGKQRSIADSQTRTVRKTKHRWGNNRRRSPAKRHRQGVCVGVLRPCQFVASAVYNKLTSLFNVDSAGQRRERRNRRRGIIARKGYAHKTPTHTRGCHAATVPPCPATTHAED